MELKMPEGKNNEKAGNEIKETQTRQTEDLNTELLQSIDNKLDTLLAAQTETEE